MKKTIKQHSPKLDKDIINELNLIVYKYTKVKNYIFQRYGSINGLKYIDNPREVRDKWVKNKFAEQWGISARYWKMALSEAFSNIKTNWAQTKQLIRKNINKRKLSKEEKHYIHYILRANKLLYKVLTYRDELIDKFKVKQAPLNKLIRRLVRKYHHKSISKRHKSFMVDSSMYKYVDGYISITSLTPRKRLSIKLTDNIKRSGNIRIVINNLISKVEIHSTKDVTIKENNSNKTIGIDKGYSKMIATSEGNFYGENLSSELINLSDKLNEINKKRNKIRAMYYTLLKKNKLKKANKIKKCNMGNKKYNKLKQKIKSKVESYINNSINNFIEKEKPKVVITEDLTFQSKNKKLPKKVNRWLNSWLKGYIQERIEYKLSANQAEVVSVNPAYTSQICSHCGCFGNRNGSRFYCQTCDKVVDADYNAAINILNRYYDNEINLYTPYKKVKEILISRLSVTSSAGPTKTRDSKSS